MLKLLKILLIFLLVLLSGCSSKLQVYEIKKESYQNEFKHVIKDESQSLPIVWEVPSNWSLMNNDSFSLVKYKLSDNAQLSVTKFPGTAGGILSNVNRWRNQVGLDSISVMDLSKHCKSLTINNLTFTVVTVDGSQVNNSVLNYIYVAVLYHENVSWFFKFSGSKTSLISLIDSCNDFISSIKTHD